MEDKVVPTVSRIELTGIIKRLEAATSRLEDMASSTIEPPKLNGAAPTPAPTGPLPAPPVAVTPPKPVEEPIPEAVEEFDDILNTTVKKYVTLSDSLGGAIAKQVGLYVGNHMVNILKDNIGCECQGCSGRPARISPHCLESTEAKRYHWRGLYQTP